MRLIFLLALLVSIGVTWMALDEPAPQSAKEPVANLPRVDRLLLVAEVPDMPVPEEEELEPASVREYPSIEFDELPLPQPGDLLKWSSYSAVETGASLNASNADGEESSQRVCMLVSGFRSEQDAKDWAQTHHLDEVDNVRLGARLVPDKPWHWVIIPPLPSRAAGLAKLRQLQAAGIDSYLVTEGEQQNAISLGLFESQRAAQRVLEGRRKAGMAAELTLFKRTRPEPIVWVYTAHSDALKAALPDGITASKETDACQALQR